MKSKKVILFNGPSGSGKDYAANLIVDNYYAYPFSFKSMVERIIINLFGIPPEDWYLWMATQHGKSIPREELMGMSARETLIHISENFIKTEFGREWIARVTTRTADDKTTGSPLLVCSDLGFQEELEASIDQWGEENVHLVLLQREGHTFSGDSRSYVKPPKGLYKNTHIVRNEGDHTFAQDIHKLVTEVLEL